MPNKQNEHSAVFFLKALYQHCDEGFINLRFLPPGENLFIPLSQIDSIPSALEAHKCQNAYFGVATRRDGDGTKQGIIQIPTLWVDIDLEGLPESEKQAIRKKYRDFPLKPSFLVSSGGGVHLYWMLKEPGSLKEIPSVEDILKRLASYFGGDPNVTDASRILRLPGTRNYKAKYESPREVILKIFEPENQYCFDDIDFLPEVENTPSREERPRPHEGWERQLLGGVEEGERNNAITRLAGRYVGKGLARDEILPILLYANSRFSPPLDEKEVGRTLVSVIKTHERNSPSKSKNGGSLRLTTVADVFEYDEPRYLIEPPLIEGTVNILGAYTGVGKSITTLSIIKAVLTRTPLWGKFITKRRGSVLLVDEETPESFLRDRITKMGFEKEFPFYFLHFQGVKLDKDDIFQQLMEKIREIQPALVVIDSLIRIHRQREDDATAMALVVERLRKIANTGTTVLVIHHHRKAEGPPSQKLRGSSDIPGGVDVEYSLVPKDDHLVLSSVKTRTKPFGPIRLKLEVTDETIEVIYLGTEAEQVLAEAVDILGEDELGIDEIHKEFKERNLEFGIHRIRSVLKDADGRELKMRKGARGKQLYSNNPDSALQVYSPIYSRKAVKVEQKEPPGFTGDASNSGDTRKGQAVDGQSLPAVFQPYKNRSVKLKKPGENQEISEVDLLEGEI